MIYRNNKTGARYELIGIVADSNNDSKDAAEAEILYRSVDADDAVHYRRKKSEFQEKFTVEPAE